MRKTAFIIPALVGGILLTGCSAPVSHETKPASPVAASTSAPAKPSPTPEVKKPSVAKWGETWTYEDKSTILVSQPVKFTPSKYAAGLEGNSVFVKISFTLTNGSDKPMETVMFNSSLTSGGREASNVFDMEAKLESNPNVTLLPGQSVTWEQGFGVADPADLTLKVTPSWDHADAFYQGAAA